MTIMPSLRQVPEDGAPCIMGLLLLVFSLFLTEARAQDKVEPEPPVRLKKKPKPEVPAPAADKKEKPKEATQPSAPDDMPADPDEDAQAILARLTKNMQKTTERLAELQDPGEATRRLQRNIVKDLDSLIDQKKQQQQNPSPNAGGGTGSSLERQQQERQERRKRQEARNRTARGQKQENKGQQPKEGNTDGSGRGGNGKDELNKIADLYKDIWGHLPEAMRLEMDQYARAQFMAKYNDLLKQYYATIAEKGRRKGE